MASTETISVGLLEVQGAFNEHRCALLKSAVSLGIKVDIRDIRSADHIVDDLDGLIIPGGESTAISLFLTRNEMIAPLQKWILQPHHVTWGTCAGMIMLAKKAENEKQGGQATLDILDVQVSRNYFGRQKDSFESPIELTKPGLFSGVNSFPGVFIRAPAITHIFDSSVEILGLLKRSSEESVVVAVRKGNILTTAFHPELTEDKSWHTLFLQMVMNKRRSN